MLPYIKKFLSFMTAVHTTMTKCKAVQHTALISEKMAWEMFYMGSSPKVKRDTAVTQLTCLQVKRRTTKQSR